MGNYSFHFLPGSVFYILFKKHALTSLRETGLWICFVVNLSGILINAVLILQQSFRNGREQFKETLQTYVTHYTELVCEINWLSFFLQELFDIVFQKSKFFFGNYSVQVVYFLCDQFANFNFPEISHFFLVFKFFHLSKIEQNYIILSVVSTQVC